MSVPSNETSGLVCAHNHLYSALSRGMPAPPITPTGFGSVLEQIWWRLDCALDLDMIYWSAKLGALEALESGTTCIIDHHESPNAIEGSLETIARACAEVGVRVSCTYGVTDRHAGTGLIKINPQPNVDVRPTKMTQAAKRGLEENRSFLKNGGRGYVGAHAAFTCSNETIEAVAGTAAELGVGVHVHVGEGPQDSDGASRWAKYATNDWLLIHGVRLDSPIKGSIVHNPSSNMNNAVGYASPARHSQSVTGSVGNPVLLGTDGIGANMINEFRIAYYRLRESNIEASPDLAWSWLMNNERLFPEAKGDRVIWSYSPMEPWHLAFTANVVAKEVFVDGVKVVENSMAIGVDRDEIITKAREQATRLFSLL